VSETTPVSQASNRSAVTITYPSRPVASFSDQVKAIARKDLTAEFRTREVLAVTIPFGAVALLLVPLAVGTDTPLLQRIGTGMFWVVVAVFGVMVGMRRSGSDEGAPADALLLLGSDPAAVMTGHTLATTGLLLVFELLLLPVSIALYQPRIRGWWWLVPLLVLVAIGLGQLATLAGAVTASASVSTALVPLLVIPLAVPLLLAASQSMERLRQGSSIIGWLAVLLSTNLLLAITSVLAARPLRESPQ